MNSLSCSQASSLSETSNILLLVVFLHMQKLLLDVVSLYIYIAKLCLANLTRNLLNSSQN